MGFRKNSVTLKYFDESGPKTFFRYRKPNSALLLCWCQSRLTSFPSARLNPDWHQHSQARRPALLKASSLQNPNKIHCQGKHLPWNSWRDKVLPGVSKAWPGLHEGEHQTTPCMHKVCQRCGLSANLLLFRTTAKLSLRGGLFYAREKHRCQRWCPGFAKPVSHGGSRGKGSAQGVAMDPPLPLLPTQVFAGTQSAVPRLRRTIQPTPVLCHEQLVWLLRGTELWFPGVFLPAPINKWLTGSLTSKLVLRIPFRVIFTNLLASCKSHPEQERKDLQELHRKKQTNQPSKASYSSITDCKSQKRTAGVPPRDGLETTVIVLQNQETGTSHPRKQDCNLSGFLPQ